MNLINKLESWARRTYNPKVAAWKRPTLFILSLVVGLACIIAGYTQLTYHWTNDGVWMVIVLFGLFSVIGLAVSIFCKDFWVALVLGGA